MHTHFIFGSAVVIPNRPATLYQQQHGLARHPTDTCKSLRPQGNFPSHANFIGPPRNLVTLPLFLFLLKSSDYFIINIL